MHMSSIKSETTRITTGHKKMGRTPGEHYLIKHDLKQFLWEHSLDSMVYEFPWILGELTLVENPYLTQSVARAYYEKHRIELSTDAMQGTVDKRRKVFISALCHFISLHLFGLATGAGYKLLVRKYTKKFNDKQKGKRGSPLQVLA